MGATPRKTYEIQLVGRAVSQRDDIHPQLALLDYLSSMGCTDEEVVRVGNDSASWRGALYKAVPVTETDA